MALVALLIAMVSIQFGASLAKSLFVDFGPLGTTCLRLGLAALLLQLYWRPWRHKLDRNAMKAVFLYGASLGLMNLFFFLALKRLPLGIAVALEFLGPLTLAILSSRRRLDLLWAGLAFIGVLLLLPRSELAGAIDLLGVLFAVISGAFWALYIVFGQRASHQVPTGIAAAWGMLVAGLVALPVGISSLVGQQFTLEHWGKAFLVAVFSSALPYSLEMVALKKIARKTFGVLMSLEPAVAALVGLLVLGEELTLFQWSAVLAVIIASAGSGYSARGSAS